MFRATRSFGRTSIRPFRSLHAGIIFRSLSDDAKQEIVQGLLQARPITYVDDVTYSKRAQWEAAIQGSIPLRQRRDSDKTYLPAGQHLLYCNTTAPTEHLLPDGTDQTLSPPAPWSNRLWAGGRIRFPQPYKVGITESPRLLLVEYVRDVRITGPEGQEKIFVKIERRIARAQTGLSMTVQKKLKHRMKRTKEEDIGIAVIVETRDLCFMRERGSAVPFERRHITPPTNPNYSHSLTPTPALLFRFSALTYNAHAIHIDPEYTRKVYGFPGLLVHGPLSLALMLEYIRQTLMKLYGRESNIPVVTEINYRNLAPLFANEEMTICVKRKGHGNSVQEPSITLTSTETGVTTTDEASARPASAEVLVASPEPEIHELEHIPPPTAIATVSGHDIGKGFPMPPSGEADPIPAEQKSEPSTTIPRIVPSPPSNRHYPQEWEVWIQTGQGDEASLAVRGTVKIEWLEEPKQETQQPKEDPLASPSIDLNKPTQLKITDEEKDLLPIVQALLKTQALLKKQQERTGDPEPSQKGSKRKDKPQSSLPAAKNPPVKPMDKSEISTVKLRKHEGETRRLVRKIRLTFHNKVFAAKTTPTNTSPIKTDLPVNPSKENPAEAGSTIHKQTVRDISPRLRGQAQEMQIANEAEKRTAHKIACAVEMYNARRIESGSAVEIRRVFSDLQMKDDFDVEGFLSRLNSDASEPQNAITGAFERTLRGMLKET